MDEKTIIVKKSSVGSFIQGIAVGAALALLLAPRTGRETRDMLSERGFEIRDKVIDEARNKVTDTVKGVKQGIQQTAYEASKDMRDENRELKRNLVIEEDINNRTYNV